MRINNRASDPNQAKGHPHLRVPALLKSDYRIGQHMNSHSRSWLIRFGVSSQMYYRPQRTALMHRPYQRSKGMHPSAQSIGITKIGYVSLVSQRCRNRDNHIYLTKPFPLTGGAGAPSSPVNVFRATESVHSTYWSAVLLRCNCIPGG